MIEEYFQSFAKQIILENDFGISSIPEFKCWHTILYEAGDYSRISELLKSANREDIKTSNPPLMTEDLLVIGLFRDQSGKAYFATVYDPFELWSDAQLIEVIPTNL